MICLHDVSCFGYKSSIQYAGVNPRLGFNNKIIIINYIYYAHLQFRELLNVHYNHMVYTRFGLIFIETNVFLLVDMYSTSGVYEKYLAKVETLFRAGMRSRQIFFRLRLRLRLQSFDSDLQFIT